MKKSVWKVFLTMTAAALFVGCAKQNETPVAGSESAAESVEAESGSGEAGEEGFSASSVSESSLPEMEVEEESPEQVRVVIPEGQELIGVYDTTKDLQMDAGSYIAVVAKDMSAGYWKTVKAGAEQAVAELNERLGFTGSDRIRLTFEGPSSEQNVDEQINTIDSVINDAPDVLCLGVIDVQSCQAQIELAGENGIPVVILDSGLDSEEILSTVATDNCAAGKAASRHLAEAMGGQGQVLIVAHQQSAETSRNRILGFEEGLKEQEGLTLAATLFESSEISVEEALQAALEENPGIGGIFCTNENMSVETLKALAVLDPEHTIKIIGFDSGATQIKAVKDGTEVGVISQNPYSQGYATMIAAVRAAQEMEIDLFVDTGFVYLDAETIDLEENKIYLYE